jgi:hypothetical protein
MVAGMKHIAIPDEQVKALRSAHHQLLDNRAINATIIGIVAFLLETIEPWLDFHDLAAVKIQLLAICVMTCAGEYCFLPGGVRDTSWDCLLSAF